MITSLANVTKGKPTFAKNLSGIQPVLFDENAKEFNKNNQNGILGIKFPASIARTIYGDHERYKNVYFSAYPGYYFPGDGALGMKMEITE